MNARKLAVVAAMWLMGAGAIAGFAWLVQWLDGTPVEVPAAVQAPPEAPGDEPLAVLTAGTARAAATAAFHLEHGDRSKGAHAVDASMRTAEIGHEAAHGDVKQAFAVAAAEIRHAKQALHLGKARVAVRALRRAADRLGDVVEEAAGQSPPVPPELVRSAYHGARLVNANGSIVGQVQRIEETADGPVARIRVGGASDVLIILDFGGTETSVPADRLLWGPRRSIGSILVALPTEASSVERILAGR